MTLELNFRYSSTNTLVLNHIEKFLQIWKSAPTCANMTEIITSSMIVHLSHKSSSSLPVEWLAEISKTRFMQLAYIACELKQLSRLAEIEA